MAAPSLPEGRFWRFELCRPGDTAGPEPRLRSLRVAAKTRFGMDDWMDEGEAERALTKLLTDYADEPVTVGDYATEDGTECGYLATGLLPDRTFGLGSQARGRDVHERGGAARHDALA